MGQTLRDYTLDTGVTLDLGGSLTTVIGSSELDGFVQGPGTLVIGTGTATLNGLTVDDAALFTVTGDADEIGTVQFGTTATDTNQILIDARGVYDLDGDVDINSVNTNADGTATITNDGLLEKSAGTGTSAIYADLDSTGTVLVNTGVLDLESIGTSTLDGTLTGAGSLILGRGDDIIDTDVLDVAALTVDADDVVLGEDLNYGGSFTFSGGTLDIGAHTLTLSGSSDLGDGGTPVIVAGTGTLLLAGDAALDEVESAGGVTVDITGTATQTGYVQFGTAATDTAQLIIEAGGTYDIVTTVDTGSVSTGQDGHPTITNRGLLEKTLYDFGAVHADVVNTGTILLNGGVLSLDDAGSSTLGGTITGAGTLLLGGNDYLLDPTTLDVSALILQAHSVTLGEDLDYTGRLTIQTGTLDLGANTLTLDRLSTLGTGLSEGMVIGTGTLQVAAVTTLDFFEMSGSVAFDITGAVFQTGYAQFGLTANDTAQITIESGGTYELDTDDSTNNANASLDGTATIINRGLLVKQQGTIGSVIDTDIINTGTVLAAKSVLDLVYAVSGNGTLAVTSGARLNLDNTVAAGSTLAFLGAGTFGIEDGGQFAGTIAGLSVGDVIDLSSIPFDTAGTVSVNAATDLMTVVENNTTTSLQLFGDFLGETFALSSDGANGSFISLVSGINDFWTVDASGAFNDANWFQIDPATGGALNAPPTADNNAEFTPSGATPFTVTFLQNASVIRLDGNALATLELEGDTLTVGAGGTWAGFFEQLNGTVVLDGGTLDLAGTAQLDGGIDGRGTLALRGQATLDNLTASAPIDITGTVTEQGAVSIIAPDLLSIDAGATYALADQSSIASGYAVTLVNRGLLESSGTSVIETELLNLGTLLVGAGKLALHPLVGTTSLDGTITGAGEVDLTGGLFVLDPAVLAVGSLEIDSFVTTTLAENLSYAGSALLEFDGTLQLAGNTLTLTGPADIGGTVLGPGTLVLAGTGTFNGSTDTDLTITGSIAVVDDGRSETAIFGLAATDTVAVTIAAGGTLALTGNVIISDTGAASTITNLGVLVSDGSVDNQIFSSLVNDGTVLVTEGFLELTGPVSGRGVIDIAADATLRLDPAVSAGTTIDFTGAGTVLVNNSFLGTIAGLDSGGTIALATDLGSGAVSTTLDSASDVLTVTQGGSTTTLQLAGDDIGDSFAAVNSGFGYIDITATTANGIIDDFWTLDASGNFGTAANWFQTVPGVGTLNAVPVADNNAEFTPSGTTPFTVTTTGSNTVNRLDGNALATLDLASGTLTVNAGGDWSGAFDNSEGQVVTLAAGTLNLSGTALLGGTIGGDGTLAVSGVATFDGFSDSAPIDITGTVVEPSSDIFSAPDSTPFDVTVEAGGTYDLTGGASIGQDAVTRPTIVNLGLFEVTANTGISEINPELLNTGTLLVDGGTLALNAFGTSALDGTITGAGSLELLAGQFVIDPTRFDVAGLLIAASGHATLAENLSYAGTVLNSGSLFLAGNTLTLTGETNITTGQVRGPGTLVLAGQATFDGFGTDADLAITGTVAQINTADFGLAASNTVAVTIAAGGALDLGSAASIADLGAATTITNFGVLAKNAGTGANFSQVVPALVNDGTVLAAIGRLDLAGPISGSGLMQIAAGATLQLDAAVASGTTIAFTGAGTLALDAPLTFAGTIAGLATAGTVDLATTTFDSAGTATLDPATDLLTVTENGSSFTLDLQGDFTGDSFTLTNDGRGFTDITVGAARAIINDFWTVDASGAWSDLNWFALPPGQTTPVNAPPTATNNAEVTPSGTTAFTLTYDEVDTVNKLDGNAIATLAMTGGTLTVAAGGTWAGGFLNTGGTLDAVTGWTAEGTTDLAAGATDAVEAGVFAIGSGTLGGTVIGAGDFLLLGGGNFTIDPGFAIGSAGFDLGTGSAPVGATVTLDTDLAYAGRFVLSTASSQPSVLDLNNHILTLTGQQFLDGTITGGGVVAQSGSGEAGGLTLNGATLTVGGVVTQDGPVTLGAGAQIAIGAAGTLVLGAGQLVAGGSAGVLDNFGLITAAAGAGTIAVAVDDAGTIAVGSAGTLAFTGSVSGAGTIAVGGNAAVRLDGIVGATTIAFLGAGTLQLADTPQFAGTIASFGTTDTIDLADTAFDSNGTATLDPSTDILAVTENGTTTSLQLGGDYIGRSFSLAADADTGTDITISGPPVGEARIWVGGTGASGFLLAGNWSPAGVPDALDDVSIATVGADVIVPAIATSSLTINSLGLIAGATLDVAGGAFAVTDAATANNPAGTSANAGLISVAGLFAPLGIFEQSGTIAVTAGGTFAVAAGASIVNTGTLLAAGGTIALPGGAVIAGGTLAAGSGGVDATGGLLDGTGATPVTIAAGTTIAPAALALRGTIANLGTVLLGSLDVLLIGTAAGDSAVLTGGGVVQLAGGSIAGATLVNQAGTIDGTGSLGSGLTNAGLIAATTGAVVLDPGSTGTITNAGMIAAETAPLTISEGSLVNTGTLAALNAALTVGAAVAGAGTLAGGIWLSESTTAATSLVLGSLVTDDAADIVLGGSSASFLSGPSAAPLAASLLEIGTTGTLQLLSGSRFATANTIANFGSLVMLGGSFASTGSLANTGRIIGAGTVDGSIANAGTIEASGRSLTIGPVSGSGSLVIDAGANLVLSGSAAGGTIDFADGGDTLTVDFSAGFADALVNFLPGDVIDLTDIGAANQVTFDTTTGILSVYPQRAISTGGGSTPTPSATLTIEGSYTPTSFSAHADASSRGTDIVVPCFLAGTRIATARGEIPVEALRVGDVALTRDGTRPIVWIGDRVVACDRHRAPELVRPVRIVAGAFGPARPHRDLLLSPDHAVAWGDRLIPVKHLVNGATIVQERPARAHYFHVELDRHDVVLAEGLLVESYLDTGNRAQFVGPPQLHPDFAGTHDAGACAPLCSRGPALLAARRHLLDRAIALGYRRDTAALWIEIGGRRQSAARRLGRLHRFLLPAGCDAVEIRSSCGVPAAAGTAGDQRSLGARIAAILIDGHQVPLRSEALGRGFFAAEHDGNVAWRWTDGAALLAVRPRPAAAMLELVIDQLMAGWSANGVSKDPGVPSSSLVARPILPAAHPRQQRSEIARHVQHPQHDGRLAVRIVDHQVGEAGDPPEPVRCR